MENRSAIRRRAARPSCARNAAFSSNRPTERARDPLSAGGTRNPVTPSSTASGLPPTRVPTTGTPAGIQSGAAGDEGCGGPDPELAAEPPSPALRVEAGEIPPVADDRDPAPIVPPGREAARHRGGVDKNTVGQAADEPLSAPLGRGPELPRVADGGEDHGSSRDPGGGHGEQVRVEAE